MYGERIASILRAYCMRVVVRPSVRPSVRPFVGGWVGGCVFSFFRAPFGNFSEDFLKKKIL